MDQLPLELVQQILANLDLQSLKNAALSCHALFEAFKTAEQLITSKILLRQIDYDVLPEAILVNQSWGLPPKISWNKGQRSVSKEKKLKFAEKLKHREPAPTKWNLADALPLAQFHEIVSYLARQAADDALQKQPRLLMIEGSAKPTYEEICRFERAVYRFQLYCNMVGDYDCRGEEVIVDAFYESFAPWEHEQLACINDHFTRVVSKPFNYLVEHDITWGAHHVPYIDSYSQDDTNGVLVEGIEKIYHLSRASGYWQWHDLLSHGEGLTDEPIGRCTFLNTVYEDKGTNDYVMVLVKLSELDEEDRELVFKRPFYNDPDPGPIAMWEWMYRNFDPGNNGGVVAQPRMRIHRQWAFPFWDASRLEATGLLGDPELPGRCTLSDLELEEFNTPSRLERLEETRKEREKLWGAGGYGYYDYKDASQVKWIWASRGKGYIDTKTHGKLTS